MQFPSLLCLCNGKHAMNYHHAQKICMAILCFTTRFNNMLSYNRFWEPRDKMEELRQKHGMWRASPELSLLHTWADYAAHAQSPQEHLVQERTALRGKGASCSYPPDTAVYTNTMQTGDGQGCQASGLMVLTWPHPVLRVCWFLSYGGRKHWWRAVGGRQSAPVIWPAV